MGEWKKGLHTLCTLALDGGEWPSSSSSRYPPGKRPSLSIWEEDGWTHCQSGQRLRL